MREEAEIELHDVAIRRVMLQGSRFTRLSTLYGKFTSVIKVPKYSYECGSELHLTRLRVVFVSCVKFGRNSWQV